MDLRRKLAQLGERPPVQRGERASHVASAPGAADERTATLETLRRKMEAILGQPAVSPIQRRADPSATDLPFVHVETEWGPLCQRLERLAPSHHVGRVPVDAARSARSELLALLALDPALASVPAERALFLDTETTGLGAGAAGVIAFLVGLAWFNEAGQLVMEQLLLRSPADEPAMLRHLLRRFESAELLVSYNGKTFDLPLLRGRFVMNHLEAPRSLPHLDLLHVGRRLHRQRLGACRLVSLESDVLGFVRGPDIEGGDIAPRYAHFLRTGDEEALRGVVEHNALDVVSMAALVGLYGEPVTALHDGDLVGLAATLRRAGAKEEAERVVGLAIERGAGPEALRLRGQMAKARGDKVQALADFEALAADVDDPNTRLELAKLYEHHLKQPLAALSLVLRGTGEKEAQLEHRRSRLERKLEAATKPKKKRAKRRRE